jgi:Stage II sporulation protein E (SpoIIE)
VRYGQVATTGQPPEEQGGPSRYGWILPYATIAAVVGMNLLFVRYGNTLTSYLVLAPVLASRLLGREHVAISGTIALAVGVWLGFHNGVGLAEQQLLQLGLIALGGGIALLTQGAYRRERSALARAGNTINLAGRLLAGVEPEEAYTLLARSARTLYAADVAAVYRYDGERMTLWHDDRSPAVPPMPGRFGPSAYPAAFGEEPSRVRLHDRAPESSMLHARGLATLLWLPLTADGATVGTLGLAWRRDPRLSAQELEASRRFAGLGARAIVGSERAQTQAEILQRIVALMLTRPPEVAGPYRLAVRYSSASQLARIGGDFYDVVEVDDGLAFIVADTRGKGLEASSLAAVLKGAFRSLAGEGIGPSHLLTILDRLVTREAGEEDFVTALVGRVHADGRVTIASAGHPLPFGSAPEVPGVGAPLGLGFIAPEGSGRLAPGERMICYTDGLIEARDADGNFLDPERIAKALTGAPLDDVLDDLVTLATEHVKGRLQDDLALLGIEYQPSRDGVAARDSGPDDQQRHGDRRRHDERRARR